MIMHKVNTERITSEKIEDLGREMPHPDTHSPCLAPSDCYLFRSLQIQLAILDFKTHN